MRRLCSGRIGFARMVARCCSSTNSGSAINSDADVEDMKRTLLEAIQSGDAEAAQRIATLMAKRNAATATATPAVPDFAASPVLPPAPSDGAEAVPHRRLTSSVRFVDHSFVDVWNGVDEAAEADADKACHRLVDFFQYLRQAEFDAMLDAVTAEVESTLNSVLGEVTVSAAAAAKRGPGREHVDCNVAVRVNPLLHRPDLTVIDLEKLVEQELPTLYTESHRGLVRARAAAAVGRGRAKEPPLSPATRDAPADLATYLDARIMIGALSDAQRELIDKQCAAVAEAVRDEVAEATGKSRNTARDEAMREARRALTSELVRQNRLALCDAQDVQEAPSVAPAVLRYDVGLHEDITAQLRRFMSKAEAETHSTEAARRLIAALNDTAALGLSEGATAHTAAIARPIVPFGLLLRYRVSVAPAGAPSKAL